MNVIRNVNFFTNASMLLFKQLLIRAQSIKIFTPRGMVLPVYKITTYQNNIKLLKENDYGQ